MSAHRGNEMFGGRQPVQRSLSEDWFVYLFCIRLKLAINQLAITIRQGITWERTAWFNESGCVKTNLKILLLSVATNITRQRWLLLVTSKNATSGIILWPNRILSYKLIQRYVLIYFLNLIPDSIATQLEIKRNLAKIQRVTIYSPDFIIIRLIAIFATKRN